MVSSMICMHDVHEEWFHVSRIIFEKSVVTRLFPDNPSLQSHVPITVQVLDVNDNPPKINSDEEIIICESTRAGQASPKTA